MPHLSSSRTISVHSHATYSPSLPPSHPSTLISSVLIPSKQSSCLAPLSFPSIMVQNMRAAYIHLTTTRTCGRDAYASLHFNLPPSPILRSSPSSFSPPPYGPSPSSSSSTPASPSSALRRFNDSPSPSPGAPGSSPAGAS